MKWIFLLLLIAIYIPVNGQLVFEEKYSINAQYDVYVTTNRHEADIFVYKCTSFIESRRQEGMWYFCDSRIDAEKTIYFTSSRMGADFIIYFTDDKREAGWVNKRKAW